MTEKKFLLAAFHQGRRRKKKEAPTKLTECIIISYISNLDKNESYILSSPKSDMDSNAITLQPIPENERPKRDAFTISPLEGNTLPPWLVNSSATLTNTNELILFGGFDQFTDEVDNTIYRIDLNTKSCNRIPGYKSNTSPGSNKDIPSPRSGHTATFIPGLQSIAVFGGENDDGQGITAELFLFNIEDNSWKKVDYGVPGDEYFARARHATCLSEDGSELVISGGCDENGEVLDDLWFFDIATCTLEGPFHFVSRYDHTIHMHNHKVWAFGGLSDEMDRVTEVAWFNYTTDTIGTLHITKLPSASRPLPGSTQGTHLYSPGLPGSVVDVVVPGSFASTTPNIKALDLDVLNWRNLAEDCSEFFSGYSWFRMVVSNTTLIMLGRPEAMKEMEENITHILTLDLTELGYLENFPGSRSSSPSTNINANTSMITTNTASSGDHYHHHELSASSSFDNLATNSTDLSLIGGTMNNDMYEFYKRSEMCDFEIIAVDSHERPSPDHFGNSVEKSAPLKVHKMVLAARWPHFRRIISSGMSESQTGNLFIPEPISWVTKLIEYMYRDSIEGYNLDEITGLLVLANVYELPRLRKLCIEAISRTDYNSSSAVMIWERGKMANEKIVARNAAYHCFAYWGQIVRSEEFHKLSRQAILALCMEAPEKSAISDFYKTKKNGHIEEEDEDYDDDDDDMME